MGVGVCIGVVCGVCGEKGCVRLCIRMDIGGWVWECASRVYICLCLLVHMSGIIIHVCVSLEMNVCKCVCKGLCLVFKIMLLYVHA